MLAGKNTPVDVWKSLSLEEQRALVERVADTQRKSLMALPNVVAVGWGVRTKRIAPKKGARAPASRKPRLYQSQPVVRILVERKWPQRSRREEGRIPSYLTAYVTKEGRRLQVAVPTDVESVAGSQHQSGAGVFRTPVLQSPKTRGALCCLVRDEAGVLWGVSCCHVIGARFPNGYPNLACKAFLKPGQSLPLLSGTMLAGKFMRFMLDAGSRADSGRRNRPTTPRECAGFFSVLGSRRDRARRV